MGSKSTSVLQKIFPEKEITESGVVFQVKSARGARVPDFFDMFAEAVVQSRQSKFKELSREHAPTVFLILNECVTVPDAPDLKVEDLPLGIVLKLFEIVKELTFPSGNLSALFQVFGLMERSNEMPQASSETGSET